MSTKQGGALLTAKVTAKGYEMRLSEEEAANIIVKWPERLTSGKELLALKRQLTTLNLPERDLQQWLEEATST